MSAEPIHDDSPGTKTEKTLATRRRNTIEAALGLPARPTSPKRPEMGDWVHEAACATRPELGMTEVERQADAADLVAGYCDACPVRRACLTEGRTAHGSGVYGGLVLDDGHLARDTSRYADAFHDPSVWLAPAPSLEVVPDDLETTSDPEATKGTTSTDPEHTPTPEATSTDPKTTSTPGQRWQPKRRTRARRRGRRP